MKAEQKILPDSDRLIEAAAEHFVVTARSAIAKRGVFYVALAGGSTPKGLYQKLATSPYIEQIDWARVQIFLVMSAVFRLPMMTATLKWPDWLCWIIYLSP